MGMCFYQLQSTNGYYVYFMHTFHGMYVTKHMISVCPIGVWRLIGRWEETIGFFSTLQTNPYCRSCFFFLSWWPRRYLMMFDDMGITWFFQHLPAQKQRSVLLPKACWPPAGHSSFVYIPPKGSHMITMRMTRLHFPTLKWVGQRLFHFWGGWPRHSNTKQRTIIVWFCLVNVSIFCRVSQNHMEPKQGIIMANIQ